MDFKLLQNHPSLASFSWSFENSYRDLRSCVTQTLQRLSSPEKLEFFFCDERETDKRWSQRPLWMPFSYSQGRATGELKDFSSGSLSIHDGSDIRVFLFYAYKYPDYPDVSCQDLCLRIRNYNGGEEYGYMTLLTCLQERFHSVRQLSVKGCDKIEFLLGYGTISCLKSLQTLDIADCKGMMTLGWFPKHKFVSLRVLKITNCLDLTTFPPLMLPMLETLQIENSEGLMYMHLHGLVSLMCLEIAGCSRLKGGSIAGKLPQLEEMKLRRCSNLILTLDDLEGGLQGLTSLVTLEIGSCQNLRELPKNLKVLTSLKKLMIMQCPEIRLLPKFGLPKKLNELRIDGCPLLQQNCQMGGCEWQRVSCIKKRTISCPTCYPYKCSCN